MPSKSWSRRIYETVRYAQVKMKIKLTIIFISILAILGCKEEYRDMTQIEHFFAERYNAEQAELELYESVDKKNDQIDDNYDYVKLRLINSEILKNSFQNEELFKSETKKLVQFFNDSVSLNNVSKFDELKIELKKVSGFGIFKAEQHLRMTFKSKEYSIAHNLTNLTSLQIDSIKCNLNLTNYADEKYKLNQQEIRVFFASIGEDCKNNAEFSQWSNEILFSILQSYPDWATEEIARLNIDMQDFIFQELSEPVHDGIDLNKISGILRKSNGDIGIKNRIIEILNNK